MCALSKNKISHVTTASFGRVVKASASRTADLGSIPTFAVDLSSSIGLMVQPIK